MDGATFQARRGHRLDPPGHPQGVSCDAEGPALGPIRLLVKTAAGLAPRPVEELNDVLGRTLGRPLDCADLAIKLESVARALSAGDLPRAMLLTQYLQLPYLDAEQAQRAAAASLLKAAPDDPDHPGWPAGSPGGRGGQFRPKQDVVAGEAAKKAAEARLKSLILRRSIRAALRQLLSGQRLFRLFGEAISNVIPVLDVIGDAALVADLTIMAHEFVSLKTDVDAANEFAKKGPQRLEDLRVSAKDESFSSFDAFKKIDLVKRFGPAGDGYEYHHIVEQGADGDFPEGELNSTRNIVRIPKLLHEEISSEYGKTERDTGVALRRSLKGKSFDEQFERGVKQMQEIGIID